jgi:hypothetical protein
MAVPIAPTETPITPAGLPLQALLPYGREAWSSAFGLHSLDRIRLVGVIVLVVERQVTDLHVTETKVRWRQQSHGIGQLAVERIATKTANEDGDL